MRVNNINNLDKDEQVERCRNRLYELYQLQWMSYNGYSILNMLESIGSIFEEGKNDDVSFEDALYDFENGVGFDGQIWACYDEFLDIEYLESDYIDFLINSYAPPDEIDILSDIYKKDMKMLEMEEGSLEME